VRQFRGRYGNLGAAGVVCELRQVDRGAVIEAGAVIEQIVAAERGCADRQRHVP
jgi:hypothetical protein